MVWVDGGLALGKSEDTLAKSLMNDHRGGACSSFFPRLPENKRKQKQKCRTVRQRREKERQGEENVAFKI